MTTQKVFFNRELSWLAFNRRVLEMAQDARLPLLERLRFLAITASNLDEFFMIRVGGLQTLLAEGDAQADVAGLKPSEQLAAICQHVTDLVQMQYRCLLEDLDPKLAAAGIRRLNMADLSPEQAEFVERVFEYEIFPLLTPMALDLDEPFPLLGSLSLHVCVRTRGTRGGESARWAIVSIPRGISRLITVPSEKGYQYMLVEELVRGYLDRLFPGERIAEHSVFRITRNADLSVREDAAYDLLEQMKEVLTERKQSSCVRLEIGEPVSDVMREFLESALSVGTGQTYVVPGPLALNAMMGLAGMAGFDALRFEPWPPQPSPAIKAGESIFDAIARQDILLFHPYEQFEPVQRLVEEASEDSNVLAIKQILYRTSENSPIVAALMRAAERGKNVTVVVELKARFDEARNIEWASELERAGAQVIYGLKGLKTHAKVCLVVRREPQGIRRYVHFGTGNYNERTARQYSDISLLTCDENLAADASAFFNTVTGCSRPLRYRKLEAAPHGLRERICDLIQNEIARSRQGQPARIMAKLNSLSDPDMIRKLYEASQSGVRVDLNVRGICCLVPGVPGLSDRIRVVSIVDRFLEHSRILYFHNGGDPLVFISSADWMARNLNRRVELLVPVENTACRNRLMEILDTCLRDNQQAWELHSDGRYERLRPAAGAAPVRSQEVFYHRAVEANRATRVGERVDLEPLRPSAKKAL